MDFINACFEGDLSAVESILANKKGQLNLNNGLIHACTQHNYKIIDTLLLHGASCYKSALYYLFYHTKEKPEFNKDRAYTFLSLIIRATGTLNDELASQLSYLIIQPHQQHRDLYDDMLILACLHKHVLLAKLVIELYNCNIANAFDISLNVKHNDAILLLLLNASPFKIKCNNGKLIVDLLHQGANIEKFEPNEIVNDFKTQIESVQAIIESSLDGSLPKDVFRIVGKYSLM